MKKGVLLFILKIKELIVKGVKSLFYPFLKSFYYKKSFLNKKRVKEKLMYPKQKDTRKNIKL